jgi:hypothetical protein
MPRRRPPRLDRNLNIALRNAALEQRFRVVQPTLVV